MTKGKLYVVTMYRWGDANNHSYVLGVFSKKETAIKRGESESFFRGRKYMPECLEIGMNEISDNGLAFKAVVPLQRSPCMATP